MRCELLNPTDALLWDIKNQEVKRDSVAATYALALQTSVSTDWLKVNQAIIARWSMSGLEYIKKRAWKLAKGESK
jgi:hypothetical protein